MPHSWLNKLSTDSAEIARYYDDWAADYDQTLAQWDYRLPDQAAGVLAGYIDPAAAVLDAGCGTGLTGRALVRRGLRIIDGIDLSWRSLAAAAGHGVYRTLQQVNMQQLPLPFATGSFGGLFCVGVLTYLPDTLPLLRDFCRVVQPGGVVVFTQRSDLFVDRDFPALLQTLADEWRWELLDVSDPLPYLPGNEEFADQILVHIMAGRVL